MVSSFVRGAELAQPEQSRQENRFTVGQSIKDVLSRAGRDYLREVVGEGAGSGTEHLSPIRGFLFRNRKGESGPTLEDAAPTLYPPLSLRGVWCLGRCPDTEPSTNGLSSFRISVPY